MMVDVKQLQRRAEFYHGLADSDEDPELAETHRQLATQLDELVQNALTDEMQLDRIRQR